MFLPVLSLRQDADCWCVHTGLLRPSVCIQPGFLAAVVTGSCEIRLRVGVHVGAVKEQCK